MGKRKNRQFRKWASQILSQAKKKESLIFLSYADSSNEEKPKIFSFRNLLAALRH